MKIRYMCAVALAMVLLSGAFSSDPVAVTADAATAPVAAQSAPSSLADTLAH